MDTPKTAIAAVDEALDGFMDELVELAEGGEPELVEEPVKVIELGCVVRCYGPVTKPWETLMLTDQGIVQTIEEDESRAWVVFANEGGYCQLTDLVVELTREEVKAKFMHQK